MSWIVNDSEGEEEFVSPFKLPPAPQLQSHSFISDFSTHEIVLPASGQTSPISNFTTDNSINRFDTTVDSIIVASTSAAAPAKSKRPKPRPAYKGHLEGMEIIESNTSAASVVATAINQISPGSSREPLIDTKFSLDIAERAKTRKRNTTGGITTDSTGVDHTKSSSCSKAHNSVEEGSSRDIIIAISSDGDEMAGATRSEQAAKPQRKQQSRSSPTSQNAVHPHTSNVPIRSPSDPSSAIRTTWDSSPLFDRQQRNPESTPPSSPFRPRKVKRKVLDDDFDFSDGGMNVGNGGGYTPVLSGKDREPSVKKQKRNKERRSREGKAKTVVDADAATTTKPSVNARKRQAKAKEKASEQEFKSKEFIENSEDDDLLLVPKFTNTVSHTSHSDPANADISVQPSGFTPTKTAQNSASIPPSPSLSVRPSAAISEAPSADILVPPPSPSDPRTCLTGKTKPGKRKRKHAAPTSKSDAVGKVDTLADDADLNCAGAPGVSGIVLTEPTKKTVKDRKGKKTEVQNSIDVTGRKGTSPNLNDVGSAEQSTPVLGAAQHKRNNHGKQGTIVSSDEDEPGSAPPKDNPVEMEVDKARMNESHRNDKENKPLSYSKNQPPETPLPHSSSPLSRPSNPKSRMSTPHVPSRRDSMSALIRRTSSKVQSPHGTPSPVYSHSPLAKASRAALSRIAPLHPNRRTPPPPLPRPPAPKKSKKMLELEEKWEMELAETVEGWSCMADEERAALRRAKRDAELGYDD